MRPSPGSASAVIAVNLSDLLPITIQSIWPTLHLAISQAQNGKSCKYSIPLIPAGLRAFTLCHMYRASVKTSVISYIDKGQRHSRLHDISASEVLKPFLYANTFQKACLFVFTCMYVCVLVDLWNMRCGLGLRSRPEGVLTSTCSFVCSLPPEDQHAKAGTPGNTHTQPKSFSRKHIYIFHQRIPWRDREKE